MASLPQNADLQARENIRRGFKAGAAHEAIKAHSRYHQPVTEREKELISMWL